MKKEPRNSKHVKKINRMAVVNLIKKHESISRQELAELTGLTPPAISGIIRELLDVGLVEEVGLDKSRGGRRPVKLRLNPKAGYVMGIEITRLETCIGIADLKKDPMVMSKIKLDMTDPKIGADHLVEIIKRIIRDEKDKNFLGIGIAFPGLLNLKEGVVQRSINLGTKWNGFPFKETVEEKLGLPIFIEHNSNASVLAERWFGGGTVYENLVYINLGEGISAGIIMDDRILHGSYGHAGEIGHIVIKEDGPLCNCGNRGCLESIFGIPALERRVNRELKAKKAPDPLKEVMKTNGKVGIEDILKFANVQDSFSHELLGQMMRYVGIAIADVINLYNPEAVFIGGKVAQAAKIFFDELQKAVYSHAFPEVAKATHIEVSSLRENSAVIGACALALREFFKLNSNMLEYIQ